MKYIIVILFILSSPSILIDIIGLSFVKTPLTSGLLTFIVLLSLTKFKSFRLNDFIKFIWVFALYLGFALVFKVDPVLWTSILKLFFCSILLWQNSQIANILSKSITLLASLFLISFIIHNVLRVDSIMEFAFDGRIVSLGIGSLMPSRVYPYGMKIWRLSSIFTEPSNASMIFMLNGLYRQNKYKFINLCASVLTFSIGGWIVLSVHVLLLLFLRFRLIMFVLVSGVLFYFRNVFASFVELISFNKIRKEAILELDFSRVQRLNHDGNVLIIGDSLGGLDSVNGILVNSGIVGLLTFAAPFLLFRTSSILYQSLLLLWFLQKPNFLSLGIMLLLLTFYYEKKNTSNTFV